MAISAVLVLQHRAAPANESRWSPPARVFLRWQPTRRVLRLVVFTSGTWTARSFAAKGGYRIDVDREFAAFGAANIPSALSQGAGRTRGGNQ